MRFLQILGGLVGVGFLASNLADAWRELSTHPVPVVWSRIVLATVLLVLVYTGLAGMWRLMARELGAHVSFGAAVQFWSIANLGRYVPGKVWQVTGAALAAPVFGVRPGVAAVISVLSFGLMIATGALVGAALLPELLPGRALPFLAGIAALGVVLPILWPDLLQTTLRALPGFLRVKDATVPTRAGLARIAACFVAVWLAHGFAFWIFCTAFVPLSWSAIPASTGSFCLSYVAGLAALIAPGGIGVREEVLGHTLARVVPNGPVHVLAVSARLWTMAAEVALLAWALGVMFRKRASPS